MESFKHIPPDPETVTVTGVLPIGEIHFSNQDGESVHDIAAMSNKSAWNFIDRLTEFYLKVGPGDHTITEIAGATENHPNTVTPMINRFAEFMPPQSFRDNGDTVTFGKLAIAQRLPTPEEKEDYKRRTEQAAKAAFEQRKANIERDDPSKLDLTTYDHAMLMIGERIYYLPFENGEAMLAARAINYFSRVPKQTRERSYYHIKDLMKAIWGDMPIAERTLFASNEKDIYGQGVKPLDEPLRRIMNSLTSGLGITRRAITVSEYTLSSKTDVIIALEQVPPATPYTVQEAISLYAPGTDRGAMDTNTDVAKEQQAAREVWEMFTKGGAIGQGDALLMLDVIMTREGKLSLQALLPPNQDIKKILDQMQGMVLRSLGSGYWQAKRNRTIAGNHFTGSEHRARQISGGLPGTTKWHIGIKDTGSEYRPK